MVRIKGANSDYEWVNGKPPHIQESKNASPLYMEIFLCPNDMPSRVEQHEDGKFCTGTDTACPQTPDKKKPGHAKIRLDDQQGITLSVRDMAALQASHQALKVNVPVEFDQTLVMKNTQGEVQLNFSQATLSIVVTPHQGQPCRMEVSNQGVKLQLEKGGAIALDPQGNIELSPKTGDPPGTVKINGNLEVTGTVTGSVDLSKATGKLPEDLMKSIKEAVQKK